MDESIKASVCASLSRAEASGKDLCFVPYGVLKAIGAEMFARVLKLREIPEWEGAVWIEHRDVPDYIEAALYRYEQHPFFRFAGQDHAWGIDLNTASYNNDWRVWTHAPNEEERKEVPWR